MSLWFDMFKRWTERAEPWLLWLLVAVVPLQRRLILFQSDWRFDEWRSGFLYGTDLLVLVLVALWLWRLITHRDALSHGSRLVLMLGGALTIAAAASSPDALAPQVSWYRTVKLAEFTLLAAYSVSAIRRFGWFGILAALVAGGTAQALIAIGQFVRQGDLGLHILGESVLGPNLAGVAAFYTLAGQKLIRAYGTMPHPNVLAMYLVLALAAWWALYLQRPRWYLVVPQVCILWALATTFSRTVVGIAFCIGAAALIWLWVRRPTLHKSLMISMLVAAVIIMLFVSIYWDAVFARLAISDSEEAVTLRMYYNAQAIAAGGWHWFGLGIGNFTTWLMMQAPHAPWYLYQPAHNLYLLAYAEIGIIGTLALLALLGATVWVLVRRIRAGRSFRTAPEPAILLGIFSIVLIVAFFDHFFWTLQQGQLMFWLLIGISFGALDFRQET